MAKKGSVKRSEKLLGEVESRAVGIQYHEGEVKPGEKVYLEREPDNQHDKNAIRVDNARFEPAGHLPRKVASWLAPLIDAGKVRVDAMVGEFGEIEDAGYISFPLVMKMYLCAKGADILKLDPSPESARDALHQTVLKTYRDAEGYDNPEIIFELGESLEALVKTELLPETRLLLALFPSMAKKARLKAFDSVIEDFGRFLAGIKIGAPLHHHNLTVFPLFAKNGRTPGYILLADAIKKGDATVEEVSEGGSVPHLKVTNRGTRPILIPEGEILVGAKQNRVVNVTVIVMVNAAYTLPVSCVERGRWDYVSRHFKAEYYAPPGLRAMKMSAVQESRRRTGEATSDQGQVWSEVSGCLSALKTSSRTESLTDAFESSKDKLKAYRDAIALPADACGFVVASGQKVIGMDVFDSAATMKNLWPRLSGAYFMEALINPKKKPKTAKMRVEGFLKKLPRCAKPAERQPAHGSEIEIEAPNIVGNALWFNNTLCHMSVFTSKGVDQ